MRLILGGVLRAEPLSVSKAQCWVLAVYVGSERMQESAAADSQR